MRILTAALVLSLVLSCHRVTGPPGVESLVGLSFPLASSPSLRLAVEGAVDGFEAEVSFDPSQQVSFVTSKCVPSPDLVARVSVPDAFGPDEVFPVTVESGAATHQDFYLRLPGKTGLPDDYCTNSGDCTRGLSCDGGVCLNPGHKPGGEAERCRADADCVDGRTCISGRCGTCTPAQTARTRRTLPSPRPRTAATWGASWTHSKPCASPSAS